MIKRLLLFLLLCAAPVFAATGPSSLKGTYAFQIWGVNQAYGYNNQVGNFVVINGGQCPKNENCYNQAFMKATLGTLQFDGAGHVKFLSLTKYNINGGSNDGPVIGQLYKYTVSGYTANLHVGSNTVAITLTNFNSAGVATLLQMFIADNEATLGTASLE